MSETVLVLGNGSREHALAWKLSTSPKIAKVFVAPGNGGTAAASTIISNLDLDIKNNEKVLQWCNEHKPSLVVVGPEDPLNNGIANTLSSAGIPCFGPSKEAAQIECSKAFAKDFMLRHKIPTAEYKSFTDSKEAKKFVKNADFKALVVKASGLAAGKGVIVANDTNEVCEQIDLMLEQKVFGEAGNTIIIEELLEGPEVSVLAFTDGTTIRVMPPAQDHKRAYDGDRGPNTGGMGAYCPCPLIDAALLKLIETDVLQRAVDGLRREGKPFVGTIYAGLMLTRRGPKVLEFNCRFGDPETQSILPLLESDLFDIFLSCINGNLANNPISWKQELVSCGVVIASAGYPASATKGQLIEGLDDVLKAGLMVFHGGTVLKEGKHYTAGGRVLSVVAIEKDLPSAAAKAQCGAKLVKIEKSFYRTDIAKKVIEQLNLKFDYKSSGVDIEAGNALVDKIKKMAKTTNRPGVIGAIGGFGALFDVYAAGYSNPLLVSGTDGVGTKLKVALECKVYDTVGIDLVAMCVNDILAQGAEPLFFLDYFACGKLDIDIATEVIAGISRGCKQSHCALIGGETAEMPGMYSKEDFDIAGFSVGAVERDSVLPKLENIEENDIVIGLPSSGVHSNGFSLIRKIFDSKGINFNDKTPFDKHITFGEVLLTPTKLYVNCLLPLIKMGYITALSHITGGGLLENIPRVIPKHLAVELDAKNWKIPPIFQWIRREGNIEEKEMLRTFNCGLGMICIVKQNLEGVVLNALKIRNEMDACIIGKVVKRSHDPVIVNNFSSSISSSNIILKQPKKRVAVLISGSGTNLQALIDFTLAKTNNSSAEIALVISNIPDVEGLKRAERVGIPTLVIPHKGLKRAEFDKLVHQELVKAEIDIVCLAGFMRILSDEFVESWKGRMLNVHPALLPSFKGMHSHKQALEAGVRIHGCTVHFVDNGVDTGAIILQEAVPVFMNDTEESLQERVKLSEHKIFPQALEYLASGKVYLDSNGKTVWNL
ncbi:trifunctional purine biosynthetic protein adenosine-3-like protein [Dinothrombium tinctorium]|uniref:Trifunctional purine biosynthetic protein adenosine-3 n=1 Tax=Dinothrombium tinctorium TaxID=1965070 RepID=A0A3S3R3Q0_9ACAR|nr:trifunctional purine biosynthetic protein adenosine-3-like protein [Dinothrombium tinctorium]